MGANVGLARRAAGPGPSGAVLSDARSVRRGAACGGDARENGAVELVVARARVAVCGRRMPAGARIICGQFQAMGAGRQDSGAGDAPFGGTEHATTRGAFAVAAAIGERSAARRDLQLSRAVFGYGSALRTSADGKQRSE